MADPEAAPLLGNGNRRDFSLRSRFVALIKAEGEPKWDASMKFLLFGSWMNVLLPFVFLSSLSHFLNWDAGLRFVFSFIAIMPLAKLLSDATEQVSLKLGPTLEVLLNASFGNAVEIIVGVSALLQGELRIIQTSMLGSILGNLLLVLGMSFFAGGLVYSESNFRVTAAQTSASLMSLSCITLVIPAAYHAMKSVERQESINPLFKDRVPGPSDPSYNGLLVISRGTSILLLVVYVAYLVFQLKTHTRLFETKRWNWGDSDAQEEEDLKMNIVSAGLALLVATVFTSFCADWLIGSIEQRAQKYSIPKPFIGLILIPFVANAAVQVTCVWMAMKDEMQFTIGISLGSSNQIAAFVVPLLVIIGWLTGDDLTLFFEDFETVLSLPASF